MVEEFGIFDFPERPLLLRPESIVEGDPVDGVACDGVGAAGAGDGCSGIVPGVMGAVDDPGAGIAPGAVVAPGVTGATGAVVASGALGDMGALGDPAEPGVLGVAGVEGVVLCAAAVPAIRHMENKIGRPVFMALIPHSAFDAMRGMGETRAFRSHEDYLARYDAQRTVLQPVL